MADWFKRIARTSYRFMRVSRETGLETESLKALRGGSITRNADTDIKESAECPIVNSLGIGPDLIRVYMTAEWEDGTSADVVLGTFLPVMPGRNIRSGYSTATMKMNGRLQELVDDAFAETVSVQKGSNAVQTAREVCEACGLTVVSDDSSYTLSDTRLYGIGSENSGQGDSKLSMVNDLLNIAGFKSAYTDPMGRVIFERYRNPGDIAPSWSFKEGMESKFEASMTEECDYSQVANHVVVYYGPDSEGRAFASEAWDRDPSSSLSTVSRGRTITKVYTYSELPDGSTDSEMQKTADEKAKTMLATAQSVVRRVSMRGPYAPVKVGDVVEVSYRSGGVEGRFQVRTQKIALGGGCAVDSELRIFER